MPHFPRRTEKAAKILRDKDPNTTEPLALQASAEQLSDDSGRHVLPELTWGALRGATRAGPQNASR